LDGANDAAVVIEKLSNRGPESQLMAYQIGFDLYESATQNFLKKVLDILRKNQAAHLPAPPAPVEEPSAEPTVESEDEKMPDASAEPPAAVEPVETKSGKAVSGSSTNEDLKKHWEQMIQILSGEVAIDSLVPLSRFEIRYHKCLFFLADNHCSSTAVSC
jgi:26S proteasome regulatory subunit N2